MEDCSTIFDRERAYEAKASSQCRFVNGRQETLAVDFKLAQADLVFRLTFGKISTLPYVFGNMTGVGDLAAMGAVARCFRHSKRACKQCLRGEWRLWFVSELIDEVCDINRGVGVAWFSGVGGIAAYRDSLLYINTTPLSTLATVVERSALISLKAISLCVRYDFFLLCLNMEKKPGNEWFK